MAKSLRSRHRRKMRQIKRVRYAEKELTRLKEMVKKTEEREKLETHEEKKTRDDADVEMATAPMAGIKLLTSAEFKESVTKKKQSKSGDEDMEIDMEGKRRNKRTLLDQHGTLPVWLSGRQRRRHLARLSGSSKKKAQKRRK